MRGHSVHCLLFGGALVDPWLALTYGPDPCFCSTAAIAWRRPWEIQFEDLALHKTIGEGSFGKVYVAKW